MTRSSWKPDIASACIPRVIARTWNVFNSSAKADEGLVDVVPLVTGEGAGGLGRSQPEPPRDRSEG